jgi:NADH-quinone oxidoreductase subunit K
MLFNFLMKKNKKKKMSLPLTNYLFLSFTMFLIGLTGIMLNRSNIITVLMSIELMLLAVNLNFIVYSVYLDDLFGQVFAIFVLTVAAAESAIGLAILVVYFRVRGSIAVETMNLMQG